ncbi:FAD-dependent monooxygenase [Streptomyces sp. NPDC001250]|uniref:FAD-dependent oxidoreductase n=1 Tax=unclassified Streptomyces TaxID=2593676 RepID=UPI00332E936A
MPLSVSPPSAPGLAGLTLAHHLHRHGLDVTVYERDPDLTSRNPGYRLHINSTGTTALSSVLHPRLGELFAATAGIPRQGALLFDEQLTPSPARDLSDSRGVGNPASDLPEHLVVDRSTLRRILHTGLEDVVRFGDRVTGYHHNPDADVTVHLADGHRADADVLIGADGINSAVRARRLPKHNAVDLGHDTSPRRSPSPTAPEPRSRESRTRIRAHGRTHHRAPSAARLIPPSDAGLRPPRGQGWASPSARSSALRRPPGSVTATAAGKPIRAAAVYAAATMRWRRKEAVTSMPSEVWNGRTTSSM